MNHPCWLLLGLLLIPFLPLPPCTAMDQDQVEAYQQRLREPEAQARVAAMKEFTDALLRGDAIATGDQRNLLPVLVPLLDDPEVQVRRGAVGCLAVLAYANSPKLRRGRAPATDLRGFLGLQEALGHALLNDPDEAVWDTALSAYALTFVLPPEMQDELAGRYGRDKGFLTLGNKILYSLLIDNAPTPKATALLERLTDDPKMAVQIAQMLRGFGRVPPPGLLPGLVRALRREEEWNRRVALFYAVVEYRHLAQPYLDELRAVRRGESLPGNQRSMDLAIAGVEEAR